ncbi:MAG: aminotransferase class I/II-fold pyridoxal phosphate-dependent enzyme [Actinobacteria bacterium]|jgi:alanine-synthesizing transaminase|nr:aminotransferase class I/II-fold pyridoxal phosphate-dependent enzyme [Actinomycetota bacterium]MDP7551190.1 aminotransferase class I/II-fold pyridoxal phosphate-dependent enzyme [Acidimicrobiales bacterium]MBT3686484.1 aminotransferase class I/II-fold pyridoxal phosphate-dependent enzyme [Actinomycetota bacterium]MBT4036417.1 aminotransferase class I/II-fold pyridoxal phosphate-dependent enzyme [Actinomycetota bacterium]MBT4278043.1 aminotransferase class I/II-fold pyridoxal phosphate-depen|tara:strand:- start:28297 stop:29475 length:1179 start_codon:yes stop_codon:yes gene_type:complete
MEFRRITSLPPYVFTIIDNLKVEARRAGEDIVDLGFGNPDLASPDLAVEKLVEAARNPRNHRYSSSRGLPKLREAVSALYKRRFDVDLDPETQVLNTIGAKEGFAHLMWVLLQPGDAALVPSPSYPIHRYSPLFAGAEVREMPFTLDGDFIGMLREGWEYSWPRPRVIVLSFPHNPTTACVDLQFMEEVVAFARERDVILVHDFAYADLGFDGYEPPSIMQVPGAEEVAVELYSMTKSFSMAGWRVAFMVGSAEVIAALTKLKSYLDYGSFQPIQIAATVTLNEAVDYPTEVREIYQHRRDALCDGLNRIGWSIQPPKGTMFAWAPIPEPYRSMGSIEFASMLVREANVAVSPGIGFGPGGEDHVRFALIENEQRIAQAVRHMRNVLVDLEV